MDKMELTRNLGRIGFSGTSEFVKVLEDKAKSQKYPVTLHNARRDSRC